MALKDAIELVHQDMLTYAKGKPGSTDWYYAQALAMGLSFLRRVADRGIEDPIAVDRLRKGFRKEVIKLEGEDEAAEVGGMKAGQSVSQPIAGFK